MHTLRCFILLSACAFAAPALAQSATRPLNLQVPPSDVPAIPATVAAKPTTDKYGNPVSPPGVYYGDHSAPELAASRTRRPACNDATYNQPQTHGSVSMGVMGGNHVSGNYQAGTFSVGRNLGSCENPTGHVGFSISVGQSRFGGRGW